MVPHGCMHVCTCTRVCVHVCRSRCTAACCGARRVLQHRLGRVEVGHSAGLMATSLGARHRPAAGAALRPVIATEEAREQVEVAGWSEAAVTEATAPAGGREAAAAATVPCTATVGWWPSRPCSLQGCTSTGALWRQQQRRVKVLAWQAIHSYLLLLLHVGMYDVYLHAYPGEQPPLTPMGAVSVQTCTCFITCRCCECRRRVLLLGMGLPAVGKSQLLRALHARVANSVFMVSG